MHSNSCRNAYLITYVYRFLFSIDYIVQIALFVHKHSYTYIQL